jgi:hypothetical protein
MDIIESLERLAKLKVAGHLSEEEYLVQKGILLNSEQDCTIGDTPAGKKSKKRLLMHSMPVEEYLQNCRYCAVSHKEGGVNTWFYSKNEYINVCCYNADFVDGKCASKTNATAKPPKKKKTWLIILGIIVAIIIIGVAVSGINEIVGDDSNKEANLPLPLPALETDWHRVNIDGVGTIDIPPTMEVRTEDLQDYINDTFENTAYVPFDFTVQTSGMNQGISETHYARILFNTIVGNKGDYESLTFDISEYSKSDIAELDNLLRQQIAPDELSQTWYPVKLEQVNGMSCIHVQYSRQGAVNASPVMVNKYLFHDIDRMYSLTFSYRLSEAQIWKDDLEHSLSTFRIN